MKFNVIKDGGPAQYKVKNRPPITNIQ